MENENTWTVQVEDEVYEYLDDPTYVLEQIVGYPASHARIYMRRALAQGPTICTDGVVLVPPHRQVQS